MKSITYCGNTQCSAYGNCDLAFDCPLFNPTSNRPKTNKYKALKCEYKGEKFDSLKELRRYLELRLLERNGEISSLKRQVKFELIPSQREPDKAGKRGGVIKGRVIEHGVNYIADFTYLDKNKELIVEDCKGVRTEVYKIKKKLMLYIHNIRIQET